MSLTVWLIFITVAMVALYPMALLRVFNTNKKYKYFKYVTIIIFIWTIHTWLRLALTNPYMQYYLGLNLYPLMFVLFAVLMIAILNYLGKPISKLLKWTFAIVGFLELVFCNTNALHELVLQLQPTTDVTYQMVTHAGAGILFYIHTGICYTMMLVSVGLILMNLYKNVKIEKDVFPFVFIIGAIFIGLTLNVVHILFYTFPLDPTYVAMVILVFCFYLVIYIRDIQLMLDMNRNSFLLENLREMYVIVNQRDEVISASKEFVKYFEIDMNQTLQFNDLLKGIVVDKAVVFTDKEDVKMEFDESRRYLHMMMKNIEIPFFKYTGKFYLFYDETEDQKYINDMNYVKSHDLMTSLYNRNHFEELKEKIDKSNQSYAIVMFDLDGLKYYNDYLGHEYGDNQLINFANRLKTIADKYNLIPIRMGGDEFLLIAMGMNYKMITSAMDDIIAILRSENDQDTILFSYGYAERESHKDRLEKVLSRADDIMYRMKLDNKPEKQKLKEILIEQVKAKAKK